MLVSRVILLRMERGASVGFNIFDTCCHMKMFLTKIFKSNQIMLNALTTIIYQSHFMQVFNIFVSHLSFNHFVLHRYNFHVRSCLSRCFLRIAAVRSVARSNGSYYDQLAVTFHAGF